MRKVFLVILLALLVFPLAGCSKKDALRFKSEYESLNSSDSVRNLTIDKNNPFIYKEAADIVSMIKDNETFIVYFGFAKCPWCRSVLPNLIKAAKDNGIRKIYYVDILEIRDTYSIDDKGNAYRVKNANESYYELLNLLGDVLEDYKVTKDGKEYNTGEKRIYAPNVVAIKDGIALSMTTGVSELQTDSHMDLTDEMNNESYNKFVELFNSLNNSTCTKEGC